MKKVYPVGWALNYGDFVMKISFFDNGQNKKIVI